jgi:hypothetical protein
MSSDNYSDGSSNNDDRDGDGDGKYGAFLNRIKSLYKNSQRKLKALNYILDEWNDEHERRQHQKQKALLYLVALVACCKYTSKPSFTTHH